MASVSNVKMLLRRQAGSHTDTPPSSASSLVSTLLPTLLVAVIGFAVFLIFRKKVQRVYEPRTMTSLVPSRSKVKRADSSAFGWISSMKSMSDKDILKMHSMDAYLWLRFLKMMTIISFLGACITWPILFPVNATGGGGQAQLDILTFGNVNNANRYYASVLLAWIFLGLVALIITRERVNLIGLRQAYYMSPLHALRLSSRTVLFLTVPEDHMGPTSLRKDFPGARKIWTVPDGQELQELVDNRNKEWQRLEKAQTKIIQQAMKNSSKKPTNAENPLEGIKAPTHRLKPLIGKKVETIPYSRGEMIRLNDIIRREQNHLIDSKGKLHSATFVEFESQLDAHKAMQFSFNEKRTQWNPRHIGVQPDEVIWKNLGTSYSSRRTKMAIASTIVYLLVLFWTIPVAVIGFISNLNNILNVVPFLGFIRSIPPVVLGVVTGLLPVILLSVLMALVPIFCRALAKFAGAATLSEVELKTQSWYFIFQVVQVFLITTFSSAATSVVGDIIQDPSIAVSLLAKNLPKASNFYISYFILQGLMAAMLQFLNIGPFVMIQLLGGILDKTPRKKYTRWTSLAGLAWGSIFPRFTNLGVIALAYAMIAPLVLGFSTVGFALFYIGFRYNFLFVFGMKVDMKGEAYAKALRQLMTGVYLSAVCLLGLYAIKTGEQRAAVGPLVLMIIFLVALVAWQVVTDRALAPLEQHLPISKLEQNEQSRIVAKQVEEAKDIEKPAEAGSSVSPPSTSDKEIAEIAASHKPVQKDVGNFFTRFINPYVEKSFTEHKAMLNSSGGDFETLEHYTAEDIDLAYQHPAVSAESQPIVWLPKDRLGLAQKFVEENQAAGLKSTTDYAWFNTKDKVEVNVDEIEKLPVYEEHKIW